MLDLIAWQQVLDYRRTAVEERPKSVTMRDKADDAARDLLNTALRLNLSDGLQLLRGDVGEILMKGIDQFAERPLMSDQNPAENARLRYDLHNLDFDGGLGFLHQATGEAPRIDALRKLVERQKGSSFLLFLTVNVRNTVGPAIAEYLSRLQQHDSDGAVNWYQNRGSGEVEYRLKAIIPLLMHTSAQTNGFGIVCHPPLAYTGSAGARMVHFMFEFQAQDLIFPGVSQQTSFQILTLPMLEAASGQIRLSSLQHDSCDMAACRGGLNFLEPTQIDAFLSSR